MEPVSIVVSALAVGAAMGLKSTAEEVVKDAYTGFKSLIQEKYTQTKDAIDLIEQNPLSESNRGIAQGLLNRTNIANDEEILTRALALLGNINKKMPKAFEIVGIDLQIVEGENLHIEDVVSERVGVRVKDGKFSKDINIKNIRAGSKGTSQNKD